MSIEMRTHGSNWRKIVRDSQIFCAVITPAWHKDSLALRQYAYARELGKPIVLLIQAGTSLPSDADQHTWRVWSTTEECAVLIAQVENGELTAR